MQFAIATAGTDALLRQHAAVALVGADHVGPPVSLGLASERAAAMAAPDKPMNLVVGARKTLSTYRTEHPHNLDPAGRLVCGDRGMRDV